MFDLDLDLKHDLYMLRNNRDEKYVHIILHMNFLCKFLGVQLNTLDQVWIRPCQSPPLSLLSLPSHEPTLVRAIKTELRNTMTTMIS